MTALGLSPRRISVLVALAIAAAAAACSLNPQPLPPGDLSETPGGGDRVAADASVDGTVPATPGDAGADNKGDGATSGQTDHDGGADAAPPAPDVDGGDAGDAGAQDAMNDASDDATEDGG